uniref:Uncharacterized protein n=1 Tax=Anguilla anguilla TaxID=7936 RepID=A0A0E9XB74_ANGAN
MYTNVARYHRCSHVIRGQHQLMQLNCNWRSVSLHLHIFIAISWF